MSDTVEIITTGIESSEVAVPGPPGPAGADGADGSDATAVEYADMAAVKAVRTSEVGIWHTSNLKADIGPDLGNPSWINAKPADLVVESVYTFADSGTTAQLAQYIHLINYATPVLLSRYTFFHHTTFEVYEESPWMLTPYMPAPYPVYTPGFSPLAYYVLGGNYDGTQWEYKEVSNEPEVGYYTVMSRDPNGRSQVAAPEADLDIANKGFVESAIAAPGTGWVTVPATTTSTGISGQKAYDASFLYICVATNTWRRVAIAAW